jgi:hypothetical protein
VTRTIAVERAFPGRGIASGQDVEMDPVAEVELKAQVEAQQLTVVGWYHSHPVFEPTPSGVDITNQLNYQRLFRDAATGVEPFVGFIVGPYDLRLPTQVSAVTCFMAQRRRVRDAEEDVPFEAWGARALVNWRCSPSHTSHVNVGPVIKAFLCTCSKLVKCISPFRILNLSKLSLEEGTTVGLHVRPLSTCELRGDQGCPEHCDPRRDGRRGGAEQGHSGARGPHGAVAHVHHVQQQPAQRGAVHQASQAARLAPRPPARGLHGGRAGCLIGRGGQADANRVGDGPRVLIYASVSACVSESERHMCCLPGWRGRYTGGWTAGAEAAVTMAGECLGAGLMAAAELKQMVLNDDRIFVVIYNTALL